MTRIGAIDFERRTVASFDGTPLGVQLYGKKGAPLCLLANGLGATAAGYRYVIERFARTFRFVSWDYRGLYSSGRPLRGYRALGIDDHARDALVVLDAVKDENDDEVHAFGWSMGVQVLLEVHRLRAHPFETLVLHNGVAGRPWATLAGGMFKHVVDRTLAATQKIDGAVEAIVKVATSSSGFIDWGVRLGLVHHDVDRDMFHEVAAGFQELDMHLYLEIMRKLGEHDAWDVLHKIACPTLLLQASEDKLTPLPAAQRMAGEIPGATLVVIPGGSHYAAVEMPALINEHLEDFWRVAGLDV